MTCLHGCNLDLFKDLGRWGFGEGQGRGGEGEEYTRRILKFWIR